MFSASGQYLIKHLKTYTVAFGKMRSQVYNCHVLC